MFQKFSFRHGLTSVSLGAMLAGCGGSPPSVPPASTGAVPQARTHQPPARSWMASTAPGRSLLYVTNGEDVYVYTYPQGDLVGTLTGFISALGECVDSAGDVFIVSLADLSGSSSIIYEYAHGGTNPIATLHDPAPAFGCAIDPTSGNLAVAGGYRSGLSTYGDVAIYPNAQGNPSMYYSSTLPPFRLCGYDPKGNLYLSADTVYLDQDQLVRLPSGSGAFEQISLNHRLYVGSSAPSSVQWDGKYMTASSSVSRQPVYLYRLRISGDNAKVIGTTTLSSKRNTLKSGQIWIQGNRALGADFNGKASGGVDSWSYPNAGRPRPVVPHTANLFPFGITVSTAAPQ
jgi:hypothetical protein